MKKIICLIAFLFLTLFSAEAQDEWYGSFSSWSNLKQLYQAVGDGVHDDTHALQTALDELGKNNHSPVLYIPKGIYRITSTLMMQTRTCIAIVGEDPLNTIIKWDGADKEKMFLLNGVSYSEFSRITWDGNGKAFAAVAHEWDGKVRYANSGTQHADEIFKNVAVGLKSGFNMDAEFSIRRCRFYNCSSTGISLQGWNALDWWVWDCYFENCYAGISNNLPANGAGNFHVYRSIFNSSAFADISLGNSNYFSFRDNVSYNSNQFIYASQFSNTSPLTIQHNTIINDKNLVMANLYTKGNLLFLDNTFITADSNRNYVISYADDYKNSHPDLTMIGNAFTANRKQLKTSASKIIDADNNYNIRRSAIPSISPKPFEKLVHYPVFEVNPAMTADDLQILINRTAKMKGKKIIHFSFGTYKIDRQLNIPLGAQIIFLGDDLSSILKWNGKDNTAVFVVNVSAKCVFRNIKIDGNSVADGILVKDNDKAGNKIYSNELMLYGGIQSNLLISGFSNTDFRFENFQHNYTKGTSVQIIGNEAATSSLVKIFGCASVGEPNAYSVDKNGRLIVYDNWYEDAPDSTFMKLRGSGEFILNGAKVANTKDIHSAFIDIDSFAGKIVLTQIIYNEKNKSINFLNHSSKASLLELGTLNWTDSTLSCYNIQSNENNYALINNRYNIGVGSYQLPDKGNLNKEFTKDMLSTLRKTLVSDKQPNLKNSSQLILSRVMIQNGINNFRVEKTL